MRGMLTIDQLRQLVDSDEIDTIVVGFTDHYGRMHGKRYDAEFFTEGIHTAGTHGCDYLLTVDMEMEPVPGYAYANWEKGYGDFHMVPDLATLRRADWLPGTAIVLCDIKDEHTDELVPVAPRSILRRQMQHAAAMGYSAKAASVGTSRIITCCRGRGKSPTTEQSGGISPARGFQLRIRKGSGDGASTR